MVTIRKLRPDDDLAEVLQLCRDFLLEYETHHREFFDIENLRDEDISGRFLNSIDSEESVTFIALEGDRVIGYMAVDIREQPPFYKVRRVGAAWGLMVAKEFRRHGIATLLVAEVQGWLSAREVDYFTGYTAVGNVGALAFYERVGMSPIQTVLIGKTFNG